MSDTYTKLFSSITESTVWGESYATRIVWVTMLAMADAKGAVYGSVPGLARRANVTLQEVEQALAAFMAPDAYSRTKDEDGRRIEEIDGGWRLINHAKYSAVRNAEERREYKRKWDQENRSKSKKPSDKSDTNPTNPTGAATPAPTPTPTQEDQQQASAAAPTLAGLACRLMREAGCGQTNPSHPDLIAALAEGVTPEALADTAREAITAGVRKPFAYAITTARGRHADGAKPSPGASHVPTHQRGNPGRRLSAVEQVEHAINDRREREAREGRTFDA